MKLALATILCGCAQRAAAWRRCPVENYGAVADDGLDDSAAIFAALRDCGGGGEIVLRGPGVYDAQPLNLTSNQVLHVAEGAVLQAPTPASGQCMGASSTCPYPLMQSFPSYTGSRDYGEPCRLGPFIGAYKAHNISITGGGTIGKQPLPLRHSSENPQRSGWCACKTARASSSGTRCGR